MGIISHPTNCYTNMKVHDMDEQRIPLLFAKRILGWKDASYQPNQVSYCVFERKRNIFNMWWIRDYNFTDLNVVLEIIQDWVATRRCPSPSIVITGVSDCIGFYLFNNNSTREQLIESLMLICLDVDGSLTLGTSKYNLLLEGAAENVR